MFHERCCCRNIGHRLTKFSYYVPTALENNVGLTPTLALAIGGCVQTMFFFGSLVPTFFLDRLGRRRPMMWGSLGLAISMMMISILLSFHGNNKYSPAIQHATSSASVAFYFTYMFIFGASANCIPWVYVPEILPLHARAKGTSVGISANWSVLHFFFLFKNCTNISQAMEFCRCYDHTVGTQQSSMAGVLDLHVPQSLFHPLGILLLPRNFEPHSRGN